MGITGPSHGAILSALLLADAAAASATSADLRDYAFGACLIAQTSSPYLREQGYLLGQIQVNRIAPEVYFRWKPVAAAVAAELRGAPTPRVRTDGPVANPTSPAPVAQSLAVIEAPRVRAAMAAASARRR